MIRNLRILLAAVGVLLVFGVIAADNHRDATRRKARHYLYEGMTREAQDVSDASYELFRKAYHTDPSYPEAAGAYGIGRIMLNLDSLQTPGELMRSLSMVRRSIDAYPQDVYEMEYYAYLAQALDIAEEAIRVYKMIDSLAPDRTGVLLRLAQLYASIGELPDAIAALDSFERREGASAEIALTRVSWRLYTRDTVGALNDASRMIEMNPGDVSYMLMKGNIYDVLGQPDSALNMFEMAARIDTLNPMPKLAMAGLYRDRGDSVMYDRMTYDALLSDQLEVNDKVGILAEYLQALITNRQDTVRGNHLFDVLRQQYPHDAEVLDLAARYDAAKGNYPAAIEEISYALDQNQGNRNYWGQLITYLIQADRPTQAMETYRRSLAHTPPDEGLKVLFATAAQMNHDYDTVVGVYKEMIAEMVPGLDPDAPLELRHLSSLTYEQLVSLSQMLTSLGDARYAAKDAETAFANYENSLKIVDNNPLTLNNFAYYLALQGDSLERAADMSRKALEYMPDNETFIDTYAWILFLQGDYPKALEYQEAAMEKSRENNSAGPELYLHYGDILSKNDRPEDAVKAWKKALELNKDDLKEEEVKLLHKKIKLRAFTDK